MGDKTKIEWTDASWTPIRAKDLATGAIGWHCEHASEGCRNCYAEGMNARLGTKLPFKPGHRADLQIFLDDKMLQQPLRWKKPRKIFVCSMTDLFASFVPADFVDQIFAVMALCPQHTFQVLTKRPDRMREYLTASNRTLHIAQAGGRMGDLWWGSWLKPWPLPNVWLGTSVEDQDNANQRIPYLLTTPAAIRFLSCEPLLGAIDLRRIMPDATMSIDALSGQAEHMLGDRRKAAPLSWVICGGESGRQARPMHPAWARQLRDDCAAAGVPFHFKQWGEWAPGEHCQDLRSIRCADFYNGKWTFDTVPAGPSDGHVDDEPDLYRVGKQAAGRKLDGVVHDGFPT